MDAVIVKCSNQQGCNGDSSIPKIPPHEISVVPKNLLVNGTTKLSKHDWKMGQQADPDIGWIITVISKKALLQYVAKGEELLWNKSLVKYQKDLMMKEGLLYRKVTLKGHDQPIVQFVLPKPFTYKTVLACHNNFGHMGMDRTLGLLQERFLWPK